MSQDPEEQSIVFRQVAPEEFCAAYNRAVAEGGEVGTTDIRAQDPLAGVVDDLAERSARGTRGSTSTCPASDSDGRRGGRRGAVQIARSVRGGKRSSDANTPAARKNIRQAMARERADDGR